MVAIVLTFVYAFAGTGVAQLLFKHQADGSITANGSTLIGQNWSSPKWFHGRPDDTGPYAANPKATPPVSGGDNPLVANGDSGESGATNLGPRSKVLLANTQQLVAYWHKLGVNPTPDLVTTSGSGYDPDITARGRPRPDPDGLQGHRHRPVGSAGAHRPRDPRRRARLPRQQLHRRPAAERGARSASLSNREFSGASEKRRP